MKFTRRISGHCKMTIQVSYIVEKFDLCFAIHQLKQDGEKVTRKSALERVRENYRFYGSNPYSQIGPSEDSDRSDQEWEGLKAKLEGLEAEFLRLFPEWKPFDAAVAAQHQDK